MKTLKSLYEKYYGNLMIAKDYKQRMIDQEKMVLLGKATVKVEVLQEIVNDLEEACDACFD